MTCFIIREGFLYFIICKKNWIRQTVNKFKNQKRILGGTEVVRARQAAVVCWWWLDASSRLLSGLETEFWHAATHALPAYRSQIKDCAAVYAVTHTSAVSCELTYASTQRIDLSLARDVLLLQLASVRPRPRHASDPGMKLQVEGKAVLFLCKPAQNWKHHAMMQCKNLLPATTDHPQFLAVITSFKF
jgi:hypothetical protein